MQRRGFTSQGLHRIFVINLDRRRDRWASFCSRMPFGDRRLVTRFDAVDGRDLKPCRELAVLFKDNDFQYRRGVVGCALSHYRLWKRLARSRDVRSALVLEDDALFVREFPRLFEELLASLPEDYDLLYVGGFPLEAAGEEAFRRGDESVLPPPDAYIDDRLSPQLGIPRRTDIGTFAYLISQDGAARLCDHVEAKGFQRAVDYFLMDCWPELRVYAAVPFLCWSGWAEGSDVQLPQEKLFEEPRNGGSD